MIFVNTLGNIADIYPPAIQLVLSRILSAVAPPGITAQENRKQCIKVLIILSFRNDISSNLFQYPCFGLFTRHYLLQVLRLWSQRGVLPESVMCHHMRELESLSGSTSVGAYSRRSSRTERSLDDPLREMEGMLVDEYGRFEYIVYFVR